MAIQAAVQMVWIDKPAVPPGRPVRLTEDIMKEFDPHLPVWLRSDRVPVVRVRPQSASPEWPAGAVECRVFTPDQYPDCPVRDELPATIFYGADGWPLAAPESLKPSMNPQMKEVLQRSPASLLLGNCRGSWRVMCCETYEKFVERESRAPAVNALLAVLPGPAA